MAPDEWFERWWEPCEFFDAVRRHNARVPADQLFQRSDLMPLLEAYAAGRFARIRGQDDAVAVRLVKTTYPDFEIREGTTIKPFELVEAYRPGDRRGDEYEEAARRERAGLPPRIEECDCLDEMRQAPAVICRAIESKARKRYKPAPHLLVYVNLWLIDEPPVDTLVETFGAWRQHFPEIWLLWGSYAIRCWPDPTLLFDRSPSDLFE